MTHLRLYTLGPPRLEHGAHPIDLGLRKALALVIYLAVTRQPHSRDHLAVLLWPESDQREGRGRLRRTLHNLVEALPEGTLDVDGDILQIRADLWLDCTIFRDEATAGLPAAPAHALAPGRIGHLRRAIELYTAEFLAGFTLPDSPAFDEWQFFQRESLHQLYGQALEQLTQAYMGDRAFSEAIPYARRWVALDSLHEPAQRTLMRLYALDGQYAAAHRQYEACVRLLDEELGATPDPETTELYDAIRARRLIPPAAAYDAPASAELEVAPPMPEVSPARAPTRPQPGASHRHPPRQTLPTCIGRERELGLINELLTGAEARRLVTLIGPGGIGKTSLALEAASALSEAFPDGVFTVMLASVGAPDLIAPAVAEALGLAYHGGYEPEAQLRAHLRDKRLLLVLDNFEHLAESALLLTELLDAAPGLHLLVTSRERLNLRLEQVFEVRGIAYPDDPRTGLAQAERFAAVQLFVDRARRTRATFALAEDDRVHVMRLCRLVEGMPLAIELAANWVRSLSCEEIADEVERSFDILSDAPQDVPPRHRSMRVVLEHTWASLSGGEQDALCRLAVFRGGFSREAANAVGEVSLPLLASLVDKGLVRRSSPRCYNLHELIRQFAADQLQLLPDAHARTLDRHAAYYLSALEQLTPEVKGSRARAALDAIAEDADNIRAAWGQAVARHDVHALGQAAVCLWIAYLVHGRLREGAAAFGAAAAAAERSAPETALAGFLLAAAGYLSARQGNLEEARALMDRGLTRMRHSQPRAVEHEAFALTWRAYIESSQGRFSEAEQLAEEALAACDGAGDSWSEANCHLLRGIVALGLGRLDAAREHHQACLDVASRVGNHWTRGFAHQNLARIAIERGEYERASTLLDVVDETFRALNDPFGIAYGLRERGVLAMAEGDDEKAVALLRASRERFIEIRSDWDAALVHAYLGAALHHRGAHGEAEAIYQGGLAATRATGHEMEIARNLLGLGRLATDRGDRVTAERFLQEARAIWERAGNPLGMTAVSLQLGRIAADTAARDHCARALRLASHHGLEPLAMEALLEASLLLAQAGNPEEALAALALVSRHAAASAGTRTRAAACLADLGLRHTDQGVIEDWHAVSALIESRLVEPLAHRHVV